MFESEAFSVVFFMVSFYAFAITLLYALARAWQKALSVQTDGDCDSASLLDRSNYPNDVSAMARRTPPETTILPPRGATKER